MIKNMLVLSLLVLMVGGCGRSGGDFDAVGRSELFVQLPDYCPTPDAFAIAPDGDLVMTCPNFADQSQGAWIVRIDQDRNVHQWLEAPVLAETGKAAPMGITFGPDGDIYLVDNQGWMGTEQGQFKGRILRLRVRDDQIVRVTELATGMEHPNGLRYRDGHVYVTQSMMTLVEDPSGLLVSGVYRFNVNESVHVSNTLEDENLIATFVTENPHVQYGLDGLTFDSQGNLFVGDFGDGKIYKLVLDNGTVVSKSIFAQTDNDYTLDPETPGYLDIATQAKMRSIDGIIADEDDNIYVADFSNNAVVKVTPQGEIIVLAQDPDNDGSDGSLNQPAEPVIWNGKLLVSNFNLVTGADKVNSGHSDYFTISEIKMD